MPFGSMFEMIAKSDISDTLHQNKVVQPGFEMIAKSDISDTPSGKRCTMFSFEMIAKSDISDTELQQKPNKGRLR